MTSDTLAIAVAVTFLLDGILFGMLIAGYIMNRTENEG